MGLLDIILNIPWKIVLYFGWNIKFKCEQIANGIARTLYFGKMSIESSGETILLRGGETVDVWYTVYDMPLICRRNQLLVDWINKINHTRKEKQIQRVARKQRIRKNFAPSVIRSFGIFEFACDRANPEVAMRKHMRISELNNMCTETLRRLKKEYRLTDEEILELKSLEVTKHQESNLNALCCVAKPKFQNMLQTMWDGTKWNPPEERYFVTLECSLYNQTLKKQNRAEIENAETEHVEAELRQNPLTIALEENVHDYTTNGGSLLVYNPKKSPTITVTTTRSNEYMYVLEGQKERAHAIKSRQESPLKKKETHSFALAEGEGCGERVVNIIKEFLK